MFKRKEPHQLLHSSPSMILIVTTTTCTNKVVVLLVVSEFEKNIWEETNLRKGTEII